MKNFFEIIMSIIGVIILGVVITTLIVSVCWNACVPALFGLPEISFVQALALSFLIRVIFPLNSTNSKSN